MSSSPQDSTPSRAGCRPRWSWKPTYTSLGLAVPQHLNKRQVLKGNQPSLFKKALLGRRCLFTRTMLWTRKCAVSPPSPILSHRQRLGKHGWATCRETCTPSKEQITLILMLHETMQFFSIYKKTISPSLGWKAMNFTGHGSSAPFILKIGYSQSMSLK